MAQSVIVKKKRRSPGYFKNLELIAHSMTFLQNSRNLPGDWERVQKYIGNM